MPRPSGSAPRRDLAAVLSSYFYIEIVFLVKGTGRAKGLCTSVGPPLPASNATARCRLSARGHSDLWNALLIIPGTFPLERTVWRAVLTHPSYLATITFF